MRNSTDPTTHKSAEAQMVAHLERLLEDGRFMVDTTRGRRAVPGFLLAVEKDDRATDLKRTMSEMNLPDRELQERMPVGQSIEVTLQTTKWLVFRRTVGRIRLVCLSPTRKLLGGEAPQPMSAADVRKVIEDVAPAQSDVPTTAVIVSTSGFGMDAHELYERRPGRTIILAEPNDAGGWSIHGPVEVKALTDLLDPEEADEKRRRVREIIEQNKVDLLTGGISSDKIAAKTQLPLPQVEAEVKSYAREHGLVAKRLEGKVVLFREGTGPAASAGDAAGGAGMPLIDRLKTLFGRKGEHEKKIAFLSERRAALSQQRDRSYEEIGHLEQKDDTLQNEFKQTTNPVTRRRITTQLVQLRKDIERRQQLLAVLNQQINVVSTHLHNLELVQQGKGSKLPDSEEIATDAAAAEEMLAQLQADNELADSVSGVAHAGMTDEEQALYAELEAQAGGPETTKVKLDHVEEADEPPAKTKTPEPTRPARESSSPPRRTEPEAG
jgi:hypothetical protein